MKILVTGAAGFIGSHTAKKLLERSDSVVSIDNFNDYYSIKIKKKNIQDLEEKYGKNFKSIKADILDFEALEEIFKEEKFDKICHLAARAGVRPSILDPFLYEEVNIRGTMNLLHLAQKYSIKNFVFASSSSVYGENAISPFIEDAKLDEPISPYAMTKKACENIAYTYHKLYNLPCIGLRFFTVFGPAGRPDMAPFLFTKWIDEGKSLTRFGDGSSARDFTFISDIVNGVIAAIDFDTNYEIFNIGRGSPVYLNDFIKITEKILGKKADIIQKPMQAGDVPITYADTSKTEKLLKVKPKISVEEGMEIFVKWYLENKDFY